MYYPQYQIPIFAPFFQPVFIPEPVPVFQIFVGNLTSFITEEDLYSLFSKYGEINNIEIYQPDPYSDSIYSLISYYQQEDANNAAFEAQCSTFQGRTLKVTLKMKANQVHKAAKIYIENLDFNVEERELYEIFKEAGMIFDLKILRDSNQKSRGKAVVKYYSVEDAGYALNNLDRIQIRESKVILASDYTFSYYNKFTAKNYSTQSVQEEEGAISTADQSFLSHEETSGANTDIKYSIAASVEYIKAHRSDFEALSEQDKYSVLGSLMYQKVVEAVKKEKIACKITGMLIDLKVLSLDDIISILEVDSEFVGRIEEAMSLLKNSWWE